MLALASIAAAEPCLAALQRASLALAEATTVWNLADIVTGVDAVKRAMRAFDVSAEAKRLADEIHLRSVYALGAALRQEYPNMGVVAASAASGLKASLVRAALSVTQPGGKPLADLIDHFHKYGIGTGLSTLYTVSSALNNRCHTPVPGVPMPSSALGELGQATAEAEVALTALASAAEIGVPDAAHRAKLRVLRTTCALMVEGIDYLLKGERSRALAVLRNT